MKTVYIVTGSIRPQFEPKVFTSKKLANKYKAQINRYGKQNDIFPVFKPVIEERNYSDMVGRNTIYSSLD